MILTELFLSKTDKPENKIRELRLLPLAHHIRLPSDLCRLTYHQEMIRSFKLSGRRSQHLRCHKVIRRVILYGKRLRHLRCQTRECYVVSLYFVVPKALIDNINYQQNRIHWPNKLHLPPIPLSSIHHPGFHREITSQITQPLVSLRSKNKRITNLTNPNRYSLSSCI